MTKLKHINFGIIKNIDIPANWLEESQNNASSSFSVLQFCPKENNNAKLYLMGHKPPLDSDTAKGLTKLVSLDAKSIVYEDIKAISLITRGFEDISNFLLYSIQPTFHNYKKIIIIEGVWKKKNIQSFWALIPIIDSKNDSVFLQELIYSAPVDIYKTYEPQIKAAFNSIEWTK